MDGVLTRFAITPNTPISVSEALWWLAAFALMATIRIAVEIQSTHGAREAVSPLGVSRTSASLVRSHSSPMERAGR